MLLLFFSVFCFLLPNAAYLPHAIYRFHLIPIIFTTRKVTPWKGGGIAVNLDWENLKIVITRIQSKNGELKKVRPFQYFRSNKKCIKITLLFMATPIYLFLFKFFFNYIECVFNVKLIDMIFISRFSCSKLALLLIKSVWDKAIRIKRGCWDGRKDNSVLLSFAH